MNIDIEYFPHFDIVLFPILHYLLIEMIDQYGFFECVWILSREWGSEGRADPQMQNSQLVYLQEFSHLYWLVIMPSISEVLRKCGIM